MFAKVVLVQFGSRRCAECIYVVFFSLAATFSADSSFVLSTARLGRDKTARTFGWVLMQPCCINADDVVADGELSSDQYACTGFWLAGNGDTWLLY